MAKKKTEEKFLPLTLLIAVRDKQSFGSDRNTPILRGINLFVFIVF